MFCFSTLPKVNSELILIELGRDHGERTAVLVTVVVNMRQSKANTRQMNVIVILPVLFGPATLREANIKDSKCNTMLETRWQQRVKHLAVKNANFFFF